MPMAKMDRLLPHPGDSPEKQAIRNEDTPENRRRRVREALMDSIDGNKVRALLDEELATLNATERGLLAAYWTDRWGYSGEQVAQELRKTEVAVRAAKCRALDKYPCNAQQGGCGPDCAHARGKALWGAIVQRIASKLDFQGGDKT